MPRISPAERPLVDLIVPFDMLKDLCHSHTPSTRLSREGSPFPIDVMLSDEAGRLPEQLFRKVVQCLELAACLYSPNSREGFFSETGLPLNIILGNSGHEKSRSPEGPRPVILLTTSTYL